MARGGRRQGTPGAAYQNRTDLALDRAPQSASTTAAGGPPMGGHNVTTPQAAAPVPISPDQTVNLFDPGNPDTPLTSGLPSGPGPGPAPTPAADEHAIIASYLPSLQRVAQREGTPDTFKAFVRHLQGL